MTRPYRIAVVDFETTGLEEDARVIESAHALVEKTESEWVIARHAVGGLHDGGPIPSASRAVHHIRHELTRGKPPFVPDDMLGIDADAFASFNMEFDGRFLPEGRPLLCVYKAALRAWPHAPQHGNFSLAYWLEDRGEIPRFDDALITPPHRAAPDANVTAALLIAMLNNGTSGSQISAWTKQPRLLPRCPIGEHRGKQWADVPSGFLDWMVGRDGMWEDLKFNARRELDRRRNA